MTTHLRHRLAVVTPADGFGEDVRDVDLYARKRPQSAGALFTVSGWAGEPSTYNTEFGAAALVLCKRGTNQLTALLQEESRDAPS